MLCLESGFRNKNDQQWLRTELDPPKSMGPDELCPRGWREPAKVTARPLSSLKDCGDEAQSPMTGDVKCIFKKRPNDLRNYRLVSLPFCA